MDMTPQEKDLPSTPVIFRKYTDGEIIAVFPYEPGTNDPATCSAYVHNGQHVSVDPVAVVKRTTLATYGEYDPLRKELEASGPGQYKLDIGKRMPSDAYVKRAEAIRISRAAHHA